MTCDDVAPCHARGTVPDSRQSCRSEPTLPTLKCGAYYVIDEADMPNHRRVKAATRLAVYLLRRYARTHDLTLEGPLNVSVGRSEDLFIRNKVAIRVDSKAAPT